jgi:hypothetical protein
MSELTEPLTPLAESAALHYEVFSEFVQAGFDRQEALALTLRYFAYNQRKLENGE